MPKKIDFTLNETELSTIEQAIGNPHGASMVKRATAVRMLDQVQSLAIEAEILSVDQATHE